MGSPLAVIGTVFRHRRTLAKTGAAVGGVLMLPILFLVMLPGLVFGDLSENTGALTSNTVISENIRASNQAIVEVLQESHDALLAKINAEIARLPEGDTASISDPYASSIIVNANQLIAQFCASQDDYKNINISKLKSLIRENEDGLFSYDVTSETATVEVPAEEENAPPRKVTFTRHTYTVSYAGDAYFADHVFHLTDKQKKTADSYVENLTMFFGGSASGLAMAVGVSDEVLAYRATIQQVAQKYGMEAYVELLMAVMMQESGGRGSDPMQAAEGGFNKKYPHVPNGITDPAYSIECGIQELKYALDKAGCTGRKFTEPQLLGMENKINEQREEALFDSLARQHMKEIYKMRKAGDNAGLLELQDTLEAQARELADKEEKFRFTPEQIKAYSTIGGAPHLDGSYTVFGEVTEGMEVVDNIEIAKTNRADRPIENIRILKASIQ